MSLHRTHGDAEELRISSALLNPDAQKAPPVELLEYSSDQNSLRPSSAVTAENDKRSTLPKGVYFKFSGYVTALFVDWCAGELLAILLSIIAFLTIIITLHKYDNHPLPRLPHQVTLNFLVSTLATIIKSTLLLAVASALGQYKWLWISSRQRRLQDLQVFDEASRGPLGATKLLTSRTGLSWASLGAIVTTLCLIFDPFIQGLINVSERLVYKDDPGTFLNRIEDYPNIIDPAILGENCTLLNFINDAVFHPEPLPETQPHCPSGNCTWPMFTSLGFCSKCEDITQPFRNSSTYVDKQDDFGTTTRHYNYELPEFNGQPLVTISVDNWPSGTMGSFSIDIVEKKYQLVPAFLGIPVEPTRSGNFNFTDGTSVQPNALITLIRISTQPTDLGAVLAADLCALSFCAQKRNVSVSLNQPSSMILQTVYGTEVDHHLNSSEAVKSPRWLSFSGDDLNMTFPSPENESNDSNRLVEYWYINLANFRLSLTGNLTEAFDPSGLVMTEATSYVLGAFNASSNISMAMDNIATTLTNHFRDSSNVTVTGQAGLVESYLNVSWGWITLPAFLVVAGTIFLLLTIFKSKRRGARIWKTSELALLFHGFEKPDHELNDLHRTSEMEDRASEIRVKIAETSGGGWILRR